MNDSRSVSVRTRERTTVSWQELFEWNSEGAINAGARITSWIERFGDEMEAQEHFSATNGNEESFLWSLETRTNRKKKTGAPSTEYDEEEHHRDGTDDDEEEEEEWPDDASNSGCTIGTEEEEDVHASSIEAENPFSYHDLRQHHIRSRFLGTPSPTSETVVENAELSPETWEVDFKHCEGRTHCSIKQVGSSATMRLQGNDEICHLIRGLVDACHSDKLEIRLSQEAKEPRVLTRQNVHNIVEFAGLSGA